MEKLSYKLPVFEGPLDLLLTLIAKHKLNIYDIPVAELLEQYMKQIELMQEADMDIQSEFFEMAARLVHIKTVMLLPKHEESEELKKELTGQLLEYQACKEIAQELAEIVSFDEFVREPVKIKYDDTYRREHELQELMEAYLSAVGRGKRRLPPPESSFSGIVKKRIVPVSAKIIHILKKIRTGQEVEFSSLFESAESKSDLVATFLAVLELIKSKRIEITDDNSVKATGETAQRWKSKKV